MLKKILVAVALLTLFAVSAEARCYVCGGADNGAECKEQNIANFSMTRCELKCLYYLTSVCFCRTYGNECIAPAPSLEAEEALKRGSDVRFRYALTPKTRESLHRQAAPLVAGLLDWPIPEDLAGPGPHRIEGVVSEEDASYEYSGEITFYYGTAIFRYVLQGHPEIRLIEAQFGLGGYGGGLSVESVDGERREIDIFGPAKPVD